MMFVQRALAAAVPFALAAAPTAAAQDSLDLVPADTFFLLRVESVADLHTAVASSDYFRFLTGPDGLLEGSGLLDAIEAEGEVSMDLGALLRLLGTTDPLDQATIDALPAEVVETWRFVRGFKGSFTLFVSGSPAPGQGLGFGLVMEPGRPVDEFAGELEALFDHPPIWTERDGLLVATETEDAIETQSAFVVKGSRHLIFVGANSVPHALDHLDRVAAVERGDEVDGLSINPRWVEAAAATAGLGQGRLFVDLVPLLGAVQLDALEQGLPVDAPVSPATIVEDLGLMDMRWIAAKMHVGEGETFSFDLEMHVPEDCILSRFLDLSSGGVPTHLLARFGKGLVRANAARFDMGGFVDLALDLAGTYAGDEAAGIEQELAQLPMLFGFDPIDDLLRQMSGEFAFVQTEHNASDGELGLGALMGGNSTFVMGLHDAGRFEDAVWNLLTFAEQMGEEPLPIVEEDSGGRPYSRVTSPMGDVFFAFGRDAFAVGVDRDDVLRALRPAPAGTPSALDDPLFSRPFEAHPGALMIEVARTGDSMGTMFDAFGQMASLAALEGEEVPIEFENLGRFGERARARFGGHTTQVIERTPRGLRLHFGAN